MPLFQKGRIASDDKNTQWKGDNVGYGALHTWVRKRLSKPESCEFCMIEPPNELANTGILNRDFENWKYLCWSCHRKYDYSKKPIKVSEETKRKIGLAQMGEKNHMFGKKQSKEHIEKKRIAMLGKHWHWRSKDQSNISEN